MTNEEFRTLLLSYFRNGSLNRSDKVLSILFSSAIYLKNARKISEAFREINNLRNCTEEKIVAIENYSGNNVYAKKISNYLETKIQEDLIGAYVHGSVGTSEEINYSDFDGFVILKNEVLIDSKKLSRTAFILNQSEKIMFEMDPLQHHGWFILTENDLKSYPEFYFPFELLKYSKCLFGEKKISIQQIKQPDRNFQFVAFQKLADGILKKLDAKIFLKNYYNFKNLLSEFMLIPAFYLQAKNGKGIFKKFSFDKLKCELNDKYSVMDEISCLRLEWKYNSPVAYRYLLNKNIRLFNMLLLKQLSGNLPLELKNKFNESFISSMKDFVNELKNNLTKCPIE